MINTPSKLSPTELSKMENVNFSSNSKQTREGIIMNTEDRPVAADQESIETSITFSSVF